MSATTLQSGRAEPGRSKSPDLSTMQRLLVGGLGGITPIVATMMAGEYENLPLPDSEGLDVFYIGFGLRIVLFFCVGALFVWLHQEVRGRYPVFRLGLTAPALIAAMIGAAPAEAAEVRVAALQSPAAAVVMSDALPDHLILDKRCSILDGFLGRKCKKSR